MLKAILAGMLVFALSAAPVDARAASEVPIAKGEALLYGLPIFTSDGVQIGAVAETGTDDDDHMVLLAEIGNALGTGTQIVAVPVELIMLKADRIELFLTAIEVRERLSSAEDRGRHGSAN